MHKNPIWPKGRIESICPLGNIIDAWTSCTAQGTYRYAWKSSYGVKVLPWVCNLGHAWYMHCSVSCGHCTMHIAHFHCTLYIFIAHCTFHCTLQIFIAHCTLSLHIAHITPSLKRWLVFGHFSTVTTERNMVCSPNKSNRTFPQIWWKSVVVQEWRFPLKWNMKSSRNKSNPTFPQIWWSQWVNLQLWGGFLELCEEKKHPEARPKVNSDAWEG